jgi:hypothetical protein
MAEKDKGLDENAKKALAAGKEAKAKQDEQRNAMKGRPTPTQEENDLAALGGHPELEPDGSPEEGPTHLGHAGKQSEARPAGGNYQTRAATPKQP